MLLRALRSGLQALLAPPLQAAAARPAAVLAPQSPQSCACGLRCTHRALRGWTLPRGSGLKRAWQISGGGGALLQVQLSVLGAPQQRQAPHPLSPLRSRCWKRQARACWQRTPEA
jgi:hypothetical protein